MILRRPQQRLKEMGIRHSRSSLVFETVPIGCGWRVVGQETVSLERVCWVLEHLFRLNERDAEGDAFGPHDFTLLYCSFLKDVMGAVVSMTNDLFHLLLSTERLL